MDISRVELKEIIQTKAERGPFILAIDGRCASGKTALAAELRLVLCCNVVHMDDFYLPFNRRTEEIMSKPGGNIDFARLKAEVLQPLLSHENANYFPYDCHSDKLLPAVQLAADRLTVVEGSYSCHPELCFAYQLSVFLDIRPEKQLERLRRRNPERVEAFQKIWIPREEEYFKAFQIKEKIDFMISET